MRVLEPLLVLVRAGGVAVLAEAAGAVEGAVAGEGLVVVRTHLGGNERYIKMQSFVSPGWSVPEITPSLKVFKKSTYKLKNDGKVAEKSANLKLIRGANYRLLDPCPVISSS